MQDVIFDEKMAGSIHLALGSAYSDADNGSRSAIHWDIVLLQTADWGGGEVYFDGRLVRKDGLFPHGDLAPLNPHGHERKAIGE
jgi:aminopeptidase